MIEREPKVGESGNKQTQQQQQQQQLKLVEFLNEELKHLLSEDSHHQSSTEEDEEDHPIPNVYFDKQLTHLVLSEEFDFPQISKILTNAFRHEHIDTSETVCRLRWSYLHKNRGKLEQRREKVKEEKRAISVAAFSNPFSLYSVDELIENLQNNELRDKELATIGHPVAEEEQMVGYNIFRDNFRKIKDLQEYEEKRKQMQEALEKAKKDVYEEKPLFFSPQYEAPSGFEVKSEEFTAEKMRKLMAFQIEMEKVGREMSREDPREEEKYERAIKKKVEKEKKMRENEGADFDDNWDEYESD